MNILVIDKDDDIFNLLIYITSMENNWNIIKYNHTIKQYKDGDIDFVIVDFSKQENENMLNEIIKVNKNQKTITISESLDCPNVDNCDSCLEQYNRKKLIKPIRPKDLYETIKRFSSESCKYYNSINHIELLLPDIMKRFYYYIYDNTTKTISYKDNEENSLYLKEFLDIIGILNQHGIKYNILNNTDIELV